MESPAPVYSPTDHDGNEPSSRSGDVDLHDMIKKSETLIRASREVIGQSNELLRRSESIVGKGR